MRIFCLLLILFPTAVCAQVHEIMLTDTAYIDSRLSEDSIALLGFKSKKNMSGHWIAYYDDQKQKKAIEANFKKGKLIGTERQWYEDGKLLAEKKCERDTCITEWYYPNEVLMERDFEATDIVKGTHNRFYSATYCNNGQIKYSPPLNPDSQNQQFTTSFYCSGNKKEEYTFLLLDGKRWYTGLYTEWFENAHVKATGYYENVNSYLRGKKMGEWSYYNADGSLKLQEEYENGVLKEKMEY